MSVTLNAEVIEATGEDYAEKLYNSLPEVYRYADKTVEYALKKYLRALARGGFAYVLEEAKGFLALVDSDKIDAGLLYLLFESYGLEIFNGIPETYLRNLMPMVSDLYSRKGSISAVEYITSIITGVRVRVEVTNIDDVTIYLEMDYEAEGRGDMPRIEQLGRIIKEFLPFYIDATMVYTYVFYDDLRIKVDEFVDTDKMVFMYLDKLRFDLLNGLSLLNKLESEISDNFILDDRDPEFSPNATDVTTDRVGRRVTNSTPSESEALSLNDDVLYDKIYINGILVEEVEY